MNNTEAEYGRNSGSIVNIVTKSGTNGLHGSVFEYFRNNALDARNYFNCADACASGCGGRRMHFTTTSSADRWAARSSRTRLFSCFRTKASAKTSGFLRAATIPSQAQIAANTAGRRYKPNNPKYPEHESMGPLPATGNNSDGSYHRRSERPSTNRLDSLITKIDQHIGHNDLLTGPLLFRRQRPERSAWPSLAATCFPGLTRSFRRACKSFRFLILT